MTRETVIPLAIINSQLWLVALMFVKGPLLSIQCICFAFMWLALALLAAINTSPAGRT